MTCYYYPDYYPDFCKRPREPTGSPEETEAKKPEEKRPKASTKEKRDQEKTLERKDKEG